MRVTAVMSCVYKSGFVHLCACVCLSVSVCSCVSRTPNLPSTDGGAPWPQTQLRVVCLTLSLREEDRGDAIPLLLVSLRAAPGTRRGAPDPNGFLLLVLVEAVPRTGPQVRDSVRRSCKKVVSTSMPCEWCRRRGAVSSEFSVVPWTIAAPAREMLWCR
ncbi:hypothetical protein B0T24DRAFT_94186 [Lasiosphaeria ovina]|uniref:Secreted protein n=1 Tax=Lasiosphaeria ovina TaxID=92902 RepID=A0AAE0NN94_9PEZI|nr:hypothetical protein B0T24DRAFT_94186 [Lasiosphaeria ovina]